MKPTTTTMLAIRPTMSLFAPISMRCVFRNRSYATQSGHGGSESLSPKRRSVTPFNDDGYVPWSELSAGEKTARATQQTFNFGFVLVGLALTVSFAHIPDAQLGREGHNSDQRNRAQLGIFCGRTSLHRTAKSANSTGPSTRSRRIHDALKCSEMPRKSLHTGKRLRTSGEEQDQSRRFCVVVLVPSEMMLTCFSGPQSVSTNKETSIY